MSGDPPEEVTFTLRPSRNSGSSLGKGGRKEHGCTRQREQQVSGRRMNMSLTRQTGKYKPGHAGLIGSRSDDTRLTGSLAGLNELLYAKCLLLCLHTVNVQHMLCKWQNLGTSLPHAEVG